MAGTITTTPPIVELPPGSAPSSIAKGDTGAPGVPNTLTIGTVTNGGVGVAAATVTGTSPNQTLNLTLPQGATGVQGIPGSTGPAGATGVNGTPTVNQLATFFNSTTIQGVSITGLVKGNGASAPAAAVSGSDYLAPGTTATITKGFTVTPNSLGNIASFTLDPTLGNYQYGTNHAAATWTAPASDCAVDILVTNDATAGAITFSGFTVSANTGDGLTTTNASKFIVSIRRLNAVSTYVIKALQ